jgi:hypothetical protein
MKRRILSLCDFSGNWSKPYVDAGFEVIRIDLKHGQDVRWMEYPGKVFGVLAAPPCTAFAGSGAQYWPIKDTDGRTLEGISIVDACMRIITISQPEFWALENPVGRLRRWLGPPTMLFDPCDFGDPYTKKTLLWGRFNIPPKKPVIPEKVCSQGSWIQRLGGSSERTKELRSITPMGFSKAFFEVNHG